jgi:PAS domain S-box-containing protein
MTNSVQESRLHLEQKVTERTSELQIKLQQLKDAHLASLNILEDLQEEKKKIESKDARDEAILASIGDGMITTDAKGKILLVNTRAESLLGIQSSKACGKNITDIWKIADAKERLLSTIHHPAEHVLKDQKIIERSDYFYVDKHHKRVPAAMTIAPVILEKKLIGMIAVFRDITHEKEVDRAKTEFVSLASHQLRTPLSAINWYTEMLLDGDAGKINKEQRHYLEEIYHGNKRMVDLVNALLNTSRIDLGTFAVEPKIVNVIDISKMVLLELQPQIAQKKIHLTENYSPEIPVMKADPKLLKIIFQNLLSNAVKYTPDEGNVSINVDVTYHTIYRSLGKQKDGILVTVTDTGYGIPKEQQGKIFTKLFRADNVREKDTEGTGLGLYIVRSIVNQAGGKIWFTSEENKGTTFFVQLPLIGMKKKTGTKSLS